MTPPIAHPDINRFGLHTWPFGSALPGDTYHRTPAMDRFLNRIPHLVAYGGYGLITGEPGTGKSTLLRIIVDHIGEHRDVVVRVLSRPQASLADFYRELGERFDVELRPHNRWRCAHVLRERWLTHWQQARQRPVILVDEAQEASAKVLSELRLLVADELDRGMLTTIVLAGDGRLLEHLGTPDLAPLSSRIGPRCHLEARAVDDLTELLERLLDAAGNPGLMSDEVITSCAEHAQGNCRALMHLGSELLEAACADPTCTVIDADLFSRLCAELVPGVPPPRSTRKRTRSPSRTAQRGGQR